MPGSFDRHSPTFAAIARRAFELHVLRLVQGYGPIQDNRFREAHEGSSPATIFLRAELDGEYPETCVKIYTFARAQDMILESRQPIWDPEFAEGDEVTVKQMRSPEYIAEEILARARGEEVTDLTAASASDTEWQEKYAGVERRAFELHVLYLIREGSPVQEARHRDIQGRPEFRIFLRAELEGEYPKTRVRVYIYDRVRDLEQQGQYWIWERDYANGDIADTEYMYPPEEVASYIMMYARGG